MLLMALVTCGCSSEPEFRMNSVYLRALEKGNLEEGEFVSDEHKKQIGNLLTAMFGTPNEPWMPDFFPEDDPASEVVSLEKLKIAAGPVSSEMDGSHRGLYREHCAHCHGITGDGAGPTAGFLNPYPRDFRLGKYKFKSTKLLRRPTDDDLHRIMINGIPGTAMPSFRLLPEEEIDALIDYVKYLSIRGEVERRLMAEAIQLQDEALVDVSAEEDEYLDQLYFVLEDIYFEVIGGWTGTEDNVTPVPPMPRNFHTSSLYSDQGRELFFGKGNCAQCHGEAGYGDGQTENYDDWTNDWVKTAHIDVLDQDEVGEFVDLGAYPPRKLRPRNLRFRVYRGGNRPEDLYRRIANGIEGASMPASSATLTEEEIWSLVAYILEMPDEVLTDE